MRKVDLNADLGESYGSWRMGDDDALLDVVTSANVACGFHAGDPVTMRRTCIGAAARGVVVGAHPSYPDLVGFGRRRLELSGEELTASVVYQLGAPTRAAGRQGRGWRTSSRRDPAPTGSPTLTLAASGPWRPTRTASASG